MKYAYLSLLILTLARPASAAALKPEVENWLAAQAHIQSWSADVVQTRTLKSLAQPLTANGRVWFQAPNRFRWELGRPAQTIAVREADELLVIYPRLKRVEEYPLTGNQTGPWRDALSLLEAGFPRNRAQLEGQYNVLSQTIKDSTGEVVLQPKSASAQRMIPRIKVEFGTKDFSLRATELEFADGSAMRNDFKDAVLNPQIDPKLLSPQVPPDYKVVQPMKKE